MALSDSSFELILQDLRHQKDVMDRLEAENRELRQQIADLRAGRGIFVDILGSRFSLLDEPINTAFYTASTAPSTPVPSTRQESISHAAQAQEPVNAVEEASVTGQAESFVPETPSPVMDFLLEDDGPVSSAPFLQDMQETDELSFETTNKLAVWGEPISSPTPVPLPAPVQESKQPVAINEDQKAALRRELIGSFLLE